MASRKRTHAQVEEPSLKERARNACASGQGSTTSELRDIARQLGIRNVSAMSKTKLCEVIHTNISQDEPVYPVTLDESDIPDGLQDPISLELMQDPIIASDGYSYDRVTLRNLFVAAQREFVAAGRPRNRPVTVRSLFDRDVVLVNPFGDIGGLPATFPLIENKSLARTIAEWRIQHGFDAPDSSQVGAAAAINAEPPESRRDDEGFHNGIFFGESLHDMDEEQEVENGVDNREDGPALLIKFLTRGRRYTILVKLVRLVSNDPEHPSFSRIRMRSDVILAMAPRNEQSWQQWKSLVERVFLRVLADGNVTVRDDQVRAVFHQQ